MLIQTHVHKHTQKYVLYNLFIKKIGYALYKFVIII